MSEHQFLTSSSSSSSNLIVAIIVAFLAMRTDAKLGVCRPTGPSDTASWVYYMGKCYAPITIRESVNFNEASNICSQLYGAYSYLASVADEEVAGFLVSDKFINDRRAFRKMMIGLRFSRGVGRWADNAYYGTAGHLTYQRFGPGQDPTAASAGNAHSDLCTVVSYDPALASNPNKNGRWSLVECSSKLQQPIITCSRLADEADECAPGSHFRPDGLGCMPCGPGTYQPTSSRTHCEPCSPPPKGYIIDTEGIGATSQQQCHRPLPVLTSIDPAGGLQAGSTMVKLEGANFLIDSNLTVGFGDGVATIVASDPTYIICQSPPYTQISRIPTRSSGITVPVEIRFSNGVTRATSFVYRPNPSVDRFEPTTFVISGGQNVAVRGSDFDAAQTHGLILQVSYRGTPYTVLRSHCNLESPMLLLCKTPDLSALLPKAAATVARQRRQTSRSLCLSPFNARDWSFRFVFVFEQTFQVSADADVPVAIFDDPLVDRWHDDRSVTSPEDTITITGDRLSCGIRSNDVTVMVADRPCDIRRITAEEIVCLPPRQISHNRNREPVMVQIGSHIAMGVGYLKYSHLGSPGFLSTPTPTPSVGTTTTLATTRITWPPSTTSTKRPRVTMPTTTTTPQTTSTTSTPIWRRRISAPPKIGKPMMGILSRQTFPPAPTSPPATVATTTPMPRTTSRQTAPTVQTTTLKRYYTEPEVIEEYLPETTIEIDQTARRKSTPKNPYYVTIFWGPNGPPSNTPDLEKELLPMIHQQQARMTTQQMRRVTTESLPIWKPASNDWGRNSAGNNQISGVNRNRVPGVFQTIYPPAPMMTTARTDRFQQWQETSSKQQAPPYVWQPPAEATKQYVNSNNKLPANDEDSMWPSTQPRTKSSTVPPYWQQNIIQQQPTNAVQRSSVIQRNGAGEAPPTATTTETSTGEAEASTMSSAILIAVVAGATLIMLLVIIVTAVIVSTRARQRRHRSWRKGQHRDPRNTTSTRSLHSADSVSTITFRGAGVGNSGSGGLSEHGTMVIENGHVMSATSPSSRANMAAAVATIDRLPLVLHNKINDMLIHAKRIKVTSTLVRGQYGDICLGKLWPTNASSPHDTITVTIKTLNRFVMDLDSTSLIEAFLSDALMLKGFYHRNVSAPYAIAFSGQRPLVIYPYYENGSLKSYITNKNKEILVFQLLDFASQIATAMVYLSAQNFVHKDLATRNCVVTPDFEVKVADNALVKDVYGREYVYVEQARDFLPVRWMAPESLTDLQFSNKSDVWSFGVLIWELLTRGRLPHSQIHNSEVVAYLQQQVQQHTLGGTRPVMRLPRPSNVPPELCDIVDKCCQLEASRRPTFGWLQERLTTLLDQRHMMSSYNVPIMPVEGGNSPTTGT